MVGFTGLLGGFATAQTADPWSASGHGGGESGMHLVGLLASLLAAAIFLLLILKALRNHRRYRAVRVLGDAEVRRIRAAILAAEKRTIGEIVPVVLERSDRHPAGEWLAALISLAVGSACFVGSLPWDRPLLLLSCQLGFGLVGFVAARLLPDFKRTFVSDRRALETAEEQAAQEFFGLGLHETEGRSGILLFVSLFERRVIVLADVGIHGKVGDAPWVETDRAILDGVRRGALADGLVEGIRRCADVLAEHFPWQEGDRNEIPDRVVVRRE